MADVLGKVGIRRDYLGRFAVRWFHIAIAAAIIVPIVALIAWQVTVYSITASVNETESLEGRAYVLVRDAPSNEGGKTIGEVVEETARDKFAREEIVEEETWRITPEQSGWSVRYALERKDGTHEEARWLVDIQTRKIDPQTDWAKRLTKP